MILPGDTGSGFGLSPPDLRQLPQKLFAWSPVGHPALSRIHVACPVARAHPHLSFASDDTKQGGFAGTVAAYQTDALTLVDLEVDLFE